MAWTLTEAQTALDNARAALAAVSAGGVAETRLPDGRVVRRFTPAEQMQMVSWLEREVKRLADAEALDAGGRVSRKILARFQ